MDGMDIRDPEAGFQRPDEKAMAVAITITSQVGTNRNMVLQTYIARDSDLSEYHTICDKLVATANRQEAILQLEEELANLELEEKTLKQFEEDYNRIDLTNANNWKARGKKGEPVLSAQETAQKEMAKTSVLRYRDGIVKRKARISKYRAVIEKRD